MLWKNTPAGTLRAAEHHLWEGFGEQADAVAERINRERSFCDRVVRFALNGGFESTTDMRIARIVLGNSLFDMADWVRYFSAQFDEEQVQQVLHFPWHEDVLMSACPFNKGKLVKDTHTAFLGLPKLNGVPLTVAKWIELHPQTGQPKFYFTNDPWHVGQPHTDVATLLPRWYLLLTEIIPGSTKKTPDEQVGLLPAEYEFPTTIAEVSKDLLVCRKTGQRPNYSKWARCAEMTVKTKKCSDGYPSVVGDFDGSGLCVDFWGGDRVDGVGSGASRKV